MIMDMKDFLIGTAVLITTLATVSGEMYNIIAVVDENVPNAQQNLEVAVAAVNENPEVLNGHELILHSVISRDNDSFCNTDQVLIPVCAQIQDGASVLLDMTSKYITKFLRTMSESMGIAHVSALDPSFEEDSSNYNTSVNMHPPSSVMLQSIRDIVSQENLTNVGIIYDNTFDLDNKPKRLLRNIPAQHLYLRMATNDDEIMEQLEKIKAVELQHLFLASSNVHAERYLGMANERGMMSFRFSWYVLTKDADMTCRRCNKSSNFVFMTAIPEQAPMNKYIDYLRTKDSTFDPDDLEVGSAFVFDLMTIIGKALDSLVKNGQWKEVNYTDCYKFTSTDIVAWTQATKFKQQILETSQNGVFGKMVWDMANANGEQEIRTEIKRLTYDSGRESGSQLVGNWSMKQGLFAFDHSITNKNIRKTYRIVTMEEEPFVFKTKELPPDKNVGMAYQDPVTKYYYYGYCIELIYEIQKSMSFDFTIVEPPDGRYGSMKDDGSWDGMIKMLIDDEADIAVAPLSVMAERENVIDFTVPYYDLVGITILMKKPEFNYSVFKFMTVLEEAVWGCVFSAFIIVSILLAVFDKYSPYSYQNNKGSWDGQGEEPRVFSLKEGLWFCMTSLTPQGGGEAPRALSGRLVAATWWMFGFIMIATYTANLAAFLTVSRLDQPIESLDDLAKQFKTKYAPQRSTATETYFKRMKDIEDKFYTIWKQMSLNDSLDQVERAKLAVWDYPVSDKFTNMWASMEDSGFPDNFTAAIDRIKNPPDGQEFAFIGDATQNKYATLTDCKLWEVGEEFSRKPYALAVQEGSPLKNELSSQILQLLNQRFLEDLKSRWWEFNRKDCPKIEDESDGISIQNIGGVFLVIFIGIGLGLITLAFEYYWYKWRPAARNKANAPALQVKEAHDNSAFTNT